MAKKNFLQVAIDNLREAIREFKPKNIIEKSDKRSAPRGKRLVAELGKNFSDKEIAESLEISRQKYTAIKKQIASGKVASPILNDLLEQTGEQLEEESGRPRDLEGVYKNEAGEKYEIDYTQMSEDYIKRNMSWSRDIKPGGFASKQSAINWYGGVTGGKEYFSIVKGKNGRWKIYDTRSASERSRKGSISGKTKASRVMERDRIN